MFEFARSHASVNLSFFRISFCALFLRSASLLFFCCESSEGALAPESKSMRLMASFFIVSNRLTSISPSKILQSAFEATGSLAEGPQRRSVLLTDQSMKIRRRLAAAAGQRLPQSHLSRKPTSRISVERGIVANRYLNSFHHVSPGLFPPPAGLALEGLVVGPSV